MSVVQEHLDKLQVPSTTVRQYAVTAVFDCLRSQGISEHARNAAVRQCLELKDERSLEVAVSHLLDLALTSGKLSVEDSTDMLLTALSVAGARACTVLVQGLLSLWSHTYIAGSAGTAQGQPSSSQPTSRRPSSALNLHAAAVGWRRHLLVRALLSNPAAAEPAVHGVLALLARTAGKADSRASFPRLLLAVQPFLGFVLLSPELQPQHPTLGPALHAGLVRFACCASSMHAQHAVLALLVGYLPAQGLALPGPGDHLSCLLGDILDVLENCEAEPDAPLMEELACHLIALCYERAQRGGSLQPLLSALHYVAQAWPHVLGEHVGDVAHLVGLTGVRDCAGLMALMAEQLEYASKATGVHPALKAMALPPLLHLLAFQQEAQEGVLKQWASHNLALLASCKPMDAHSTQRGSASGDAPGGAVGRESDPNAEDSPRGIPLWAGQGAAALTGQALRMLRSFWRESGQAKEWLCWARASLQAVAESRSGQPGSKQQRGLHPHARTMLCALLYHPDHSTQMAALGTLEAAVQAVPLMGMTVLPVLLHRTQQLLEGFLSAVRSSANEVMGVGQGEQPPPSLLPTLRAIPQLAQHAAVVPFVVRALQPLLSPGSPELLHAVALRLLCLLWRRTGRGYQHLRSAILGYAPAGGTPGLDLRISRAACLREICEKDPGKAVELIKLVQESLGDVAPQVQALGLQCISLLCEADSLDFYKAWRVVQARFPALPPQPKAAAAWVELMGQGVLDADVYPEVAKKIVQALWLATEHSAPQVRHQAYCSLSAYSFDLLEQIQALPPLIEYVQLLQLEHHPPNRPLCEQLVIAALQHEHATRRRPGVALGAAHQLGESRRRTRNPRGAPAGRDDSSVTKHRLLATLPKLLLGGSTSSTTDVLQRVPELPAAAVLSLYAPPGPAFPTPAAKAAAAREAAVAYQLLLSHLAKHPIAAQLSTPADPAGAACTAAWRRFLTRWVGALRAAADVAGQGVRPGATSAASSQGPAVTVWDQIHPLLSHHTPQVAENAAWAAAALCSLGGQPVKEVVHAVHAALTGLACSAQAPAAARRAATLALGCQAGTFLQVLGEPSLSSWMETLTATVGSGVEGTATSRSAAVQALGLLCRGVAGPPGIAAATGRKSGDSLAQVPPGFEGGSRSAGTAGVLRGALGTLLSMLCLLCQPTGAAGCLQEAATDARLVVGGSFSLEDRDPCDGGELLLAVCAGLSHAVPAMADMGHRGLLCTLHDLLLCQLRQPPQQAQRASHHLRHAACALLASLTATGFHRGWLSNDDVTATLAALLSLLGGSAADRGGGSREEGLAQELDGRVVGSAAAALGVLLPAVISQGYSPSGAYTLESIVQELLGLAESALGRASHAAAAKQGLAAGIAQLLAPPGGLPLTSPCFKPALAALEGLALQGGDPRVRRACGGVLADLCYRSKKQEARGARAVSGESAGGGMQAGKSLAALPQEGVMRPLVESLISGAWSEAIEGCDGGGEAQPEEGLPLELTSADVASTFKCLAEAPRLPALPFGTLCRRALRRHAGHAEVEHGCVQLAAAHGQTQANHLGEFIAEMLHPSGMAQLQPATQLAVLGALGPLLSALPDSQAAATLRMLCTLCPDLSKGSAAAGGGVGGHEWVAALLLGLHGMLSQHQQGGQSRQSTARGADQQQPAAPAPEVDTAVQEALVKVVLPRLPPPGTLPLSVACDSAAGAAHGIHASASPDAKESDPTLGVQCCWQAAVDCFGVLPAGKLEPLLANPRLCSGLPLQASFLAASLVAGGVLGQRALHPPRNLLLSGALPGSAPGSEDGEEEAVALAVGRAVATLPTPQQQQWVMDVLEAAKVCTHPEGALKLACCVVSAAAAAAAAAAGAELAAEHVTAGSCQAAVATLGRSLLALGEAPGWSGHVLGGLLAKLAHAVEVVHSRGTASIAGTAGVEAAQAVVAGGEGVGRQGGHLAGEDSQMRVVCVWKRVARAALVANRHSLSPDLWATLAAWLAAL